MLAIRVYRYVKGSEAVEPLRELNPMGEELRDAVLFLAVTSFHTRIRLGLGSGSDESINHADAPAMVGTKRRQALHALRPVPERSTPVT